MGRIVSKVRQARLDYAQRRGRVVSVQEVAQAIGVTRGALSKMERGVVSISFGVLARLCEFYQLKPGDLLDYEDQTRRVAATREGQHSDTASAAGSTSGGSIVAYALPLPI